MRAAVHGFRFLFGLDCPESQVTPNELECLLAYVDGAQIVVEIGCFEGKTTVELARRTRGRVYSIDPFPRGRLGICYGEIIARAHCRRSAVDNVEIIRRLSHEAAPLFKHPIDFLFIDADHDYEALKRDWVDWFPKVRKSGIVALHDCRLASNSPEYLGSMRFYEHDVPRVDGIEEIEGVDSLAIFRVR
jgi:predicted O-methyltransferase YrrM